MENYTPMESEFASIVVGNSFRDHIANLREALLRFRKYGLKPFKESRKEWREVGARAS